MAAATKNLTIEQRADFELSMVYRNKLKKAIDLTGCSARLQIRDAAGNLVAEASTENGRIKLGGTAGTIYIHIPASVTSAMAFATALYDFKLIFATGIEKRILQGKVVLSIGQTV